MDGCDRFFLGLLMRLIHSYLIANVRLRYCVALSSLTN
jgi:hypothetical protein